MDQSPNNTIGVAAAQAPSVIMAELERVEKGIYDLLNRLDSIITPVPSSDIAPAPGNSLSSRLHLVNSALDHILTNIEL